MDRDIYHSDDRAVILTVEWDYTRPFYAPAADAFREAARTRLYALARDAYAACDDRRKRYRFPAWHAAFRVTECDGGTELCISLNGRILRRERHIFDGEILLKRERLQDKL